MEEIQLSAFQKNTSGIIEDVIRSHRSIIICYKERNLVKISPIVSAEYCSWLGCMKGKGSVKGDIIAPAEEQNA
jgi:hypothetical protein